MIVELVYKGDITRAARELLEYGTITQETCDWVVANWRDMRSEVNECLEDYVTECVKSTIWNKQFRAELDRKLAVCEVE
jgi:hypothetical protein